MKTGARILTPPDPVCIQLNPKNTEAIMTTRQTGGLLAPIRGCYQPAPKDAGFHSVQALTPLTRRSP